MKTIDDALEVRGRIFGAFELAELEEDAARRAAWLTFVVVGAGPTGVEMAGQIAELSRHSLRVELQPDRHRRRAHRPARRRTADPADLRRARSRSGRRRSSSGWASRSGRTRLVTGMDAEGVELTDDPLASSGSGRDEDLVGGRARPRRSGACSPTQAAAEATAPGQVPVEPDCTLPGHPEVFVVGDLMALDGLPGLARGRDPVGPARRGRDPAAARRRRERRGLSATATSAASRRSRATTRSASAGAPGLRDSPAGCSGSSSTSPS